MLTLRAHKAAFTLIEMLVVIAIISVMMAIAVPTLHRIGIFGRDDVHTSARDLLTKLKAARIYAGANRVDTAVVYSVTERIDSETNNPTLVVDGMAIVRRLKREEVEALQQAIPASHPDRATLLAMLAGSEAPDAYPFVPIKDEDGVFQMLPDDAVVTDKILWASTNPNDPTVLPIEPTLSATLNDDGVTHIYPVMGLSPIRVVRIEVDPDAGVFEIEPILPRVIPGSDPVKYYEYRPDPAEPYTRGRFPAHVFKPTGVLQTDGRDQKARYVLEVGPSPHLSQEERFVVHDDGTTEPVPNSQVELFPLTGRVHGLS